MDINILLESIYISIVFIPAIHLLRVGIVIISRKGYAHRSINEKNLVWVSLGIVFSNPNLRNSSEYIFVILAMVCAIVFILLSLIDYNRKFRLTIYNISLDYLTCILDEIFVKNGVIYELKADIYILDKFRHEVIIRNWRKEEKLIEVISSLKKNLSNTSHKKIRTLGVINVFLGVTLIVGGFYYFKFIVL